MVKILILIAFVIFGSTQSNPVYGASSEHTVSVTADFFVLEKDLKFEIVQCGEPIQPGRCYQVKVMPIQDGQKTPPVIKTLLKYVEDDQDKKFVLNFEFKFKDQIFKAKIWLCGEPFPVSPPRWKAKLKMTGYIDDNKQIHADIDGDGTWYLNPTK